MVAMIWLITIVHQWPRPNAPRGFAKHSVGMSVFLDFALMASRYNTCDHVCPKRCP